MPLTSRQSRRRRDAGGGSAVAAPGRVHGLAGRPGVSAVAGPRLRLSSEPLRRCRCSVESAAVRCCFTWNSRAGCRWTLAGRAESGTTTAEPCTRGTSELISTGLSTYPQGRRLRSPSPGSSRMRCAEGYPHGHPHRCGQVRRGCESPLLPRQRSPPRVPRETCRPPTLSGHAQCPPPRRRRGESRVLLPIGTGEPARTPPKKS
jgi:hypothetical protein